MSTNETQADYSLEISIVRKFSSDGAAQCTRSYTYQNLRDAPFVVDWTVAFRVTDSNVRAANTARASTGETLTATTRAEGGKVTISAKPSVTIPPGTSWSLEFAYSHPYQANYVRSLDLWLCHENWRFSGSRVGEPRETTPRQYRYSAQILDERRKVLGIPILLQVLEASGYPERKIQPTKGYLELAWDFNVHKDRPYELTVMYAERPWKYREWLIRTVAVLAAVAITAATGVEIPLPV